MDSGNMDVTIVYSTDGLNKKFNLVTLEDDQKFFPEYIQAYYYVVNLYHKFLFSAAKIRKSVNNTGITSAENKWPHLKKALPLQSEKIE